MKSERAIEGRAFEAAGYVPERRRESAEHESQFAPGADDGSRREGVGPPRKNRPTDVGVDEARRAHGQCRTQG